MLRSRVRGGTIWGTSSLLGFMLNLRIRRFLLPIALVSTVLCLCAFQLRSRLMSPPSMADVRALAEKAPIVFRGHVAKVSSFGVKPRHTIALASIPKFEVDRSHRGKARTEDSLYFVYGDLSARLKSHHCNDSQPDTSELELARDR